MKPPNKIAVIGATGMLGIPVAAALVEAGFAVTALVRDPAQARRVLPSAISLVAADVRDEESLRTGLAGHDGLYLSLSVAPSERPCDFHTEAQGLQNILAAARDANVARIAYLSALVHDSPSRWWVIGIWQQALARVEASGIPFTIFYPTNFMETLAERHAAGSRFVMLGRSRHANYWIAGADFGKQVARAFALPEAANRAYCIQGPEPATYDEAAARYVAAQQDMRSIVRLPLWLVRTGGLFSRQLDFNARIMQTVLDYPETFKATDTWAELGEPTITIEQFAAQRRLQPA